MKEKIKVFWLKYRFFIIVAFILLLLGYIGLRELHQRNLAAKYSALETEYSLIQKERDEYKKTADELAISYDELIKDRDAKVAELEQKKKELYWLQVKHKQEIDSLLNINIPNDSVYKHTGLIYPNFDSGELKYPYSGSQIRQIYSVGIRFPRLQEEYGLQTKVLDNCYTLNNAYEVTENNLKAQLANLNKDILAANAQLNVREKENTLLSRQINTKKFWSIVWKGAAASGWIYSALK